MAPFPRGLYITLRDADGAVVRDIPDPFGGTFDASGDFDELVNWDVSPLLAAIDTEGETTLVSSVTGLTAEVDALLATIPEQARMRNGRGGAAWRALTRFRVMARLCGADSRSALNCLGN